jgi:hypothetical protein
MTPLVCLIHRVEVLTPQSTVVNRSRKHAPSIRFLRGSWALNEMLRQHCCPSGGGGPTFLEEPGLAKRLIRKELINKNVEQTPSVSVAIPASPRFEHGKHGPPDARKKLLATHFYALGIRNQGWFHARPWHLATEVFLRPELHQLVNSTTPEENHAPMMLRCGRFNRIGHYNH